MTSIEWTEKSWNPIVGCSIISKGCRSCYAMKMAYRQEYGFKTPHYAGTTKKVNGNAVWTGKLNFAPKHILLEPLNRKKPTTYFVNSMSDLFHEDMSDDWIDRIFAVMALSPQHTFQVLTKRPERMKLYFRAGLKHQHICAEMDKLTGGDLMPPSLPLKNVWLGVSAEDQKRADERIPHLLNTPAAVRFVSAEPLLGPIDLEYPKGVFPDGPTMCCNGYECGCMGRPIDAPLIHGLDWVIVGCESGHKKRPMNEDWVRNIRGQCEEWQTKFFYKQSIENGKKIARPFLDGRQWTQIPEIAA